MSKIVVRKTNLQSEENKVLKEQKRGGGANHKTKSRVKGPKLRESHLVLPPELGNENCHAIHLRRLESHLSCPCRI